MCNKLWPYESWYVFRQSKSSFAQQNKRTSTHINFIVEVKEFGMKNKNFRVRYNRMLEEFNQDMHEINALPERFTVPITEEIKRVISQHKPREQKK